jgi:ATP-dependent helicase/DNAse subunit B
VSGNPAATYRDLHEHLGAPKSCVPDTGGAALSESRWWLRGVAAAGEASRPDVFARYPSLDAGARALAARAGAAFTEYDGHVPEAGVVLDPYRSEIVVSPTQLERAAACPFKHFVERGLGVSAIESGERDRDVWLDHLLRGSLLHDLYAQLLRRCRAAKRRVTVKDDGRWLRQRGEEVLQALEAEMPPPSEEVRERETRLFLDDLAIFVEAEAAMDASREAIAFEVGFGRAGASSEEPLARPDPIVIDIGGVKLRVAGQIDRIDQVAPSVFEIVDYKTGGYWRADWEGTFAGGTRLQHALYGLAALELLKNKVKKPSIRAAEYYFSSAKGTQERKRIDAQPASAVAGVLADLRQVIASGLFVHAADEKHCKWCDHGHACGRNAAARAAAKKDDPALAPFRKLAAHE